MNTDDFESRLSRQPLRTPPAEWRKEILHAASSGDSQSAFGFALVLAWLNPSRPGWIALGAAWLVIMAFNFMDADSQETQAVASVVSAEGWLERRRLMAELLPAEEPAASKVLVPRPRSERRRESQMILI